MEKQPSLVGASPTITETKAPLKPKYSHMIFRRSVETGQ